MQLAEAKIGRATIDGSENRRFERCRIVVS